MIVEAAVLVVEHDQQRPGPQRRVGPQRVVDAGNEHLPAQDVTRRMLIVLVREVVRLNEGELRKVVGRPSRVREERLEAAVLRGVARSQLMREHQRLRHVTVVDVPGDLLRVQPVVERVLVVVVQIEVERRVGHLHTAERGAAVHEQPVGPGRTGH